MGASELHAVYRLGCMHRRPFWIWSHSAPASPPSPPPLPRPPPPPPPRLPAPPGLPPPGTRTVTPAHMPASMTDEAAPLCFQRYRPVHQRLQPGVLEAVALRVAHPPHLALFVLDRTRHVGEQGLLLLQLLVEGRARLVRVRVRLRARVRVRGRGRGRVRARAGEGVG